MATSPAHQRRQFAERAESHKGGLIGYFTISSGVSWSGNRCCCTFDAFKMSVRQVNCYAYGQLHAGVTQLLMHHANAWWVSVQGTL